MSNKRDALQFLVGRGEPLTTLAIFDELKECESRGNAVVLMSTLKKEGLVTIAGKTNGADGERPQNLWRITPAGARWLSESAGAENRAGGGGSKAAATRQKPKRKYRKRKAAGMARKVARKRRRAPKAAARPRAKRANALQVAPTGNLWALRSDGTFVLEGSPLIIQRADARALVDFIRVLDGGAM